MQHPISCTLIGFLRTTFDFLVQLHDFRSAFAIIHYKRHVRAQSQKLHIILRNVLSNTGHWRNISFLTYNNDYKVYETKTLRSKTIKERYYKETNTYIRIKKQRR